MKAKDYFILLACFRDGLSLQDHLINELTIFSLVYIRIIVSVIKARKLF